MQSSPFLIYLFQNTEFISYFNKEELSMLREVDPFLQKIIEKQFYPQLHHYSWLQKCRMYDPHTAWIVNNKLCSCYSPDEKKWTSIYLLKKMPSIIPIKLWSYFFSLCQSFVSLQHFELWHQFIPKPLSSINGNTTWNITMSVDIIGNNDTDVEDLEDDDDEEHAVWNLINEFVSVGILIDETEKNDILGMNDVSIGYHSDDGCIYLSSLIIGRAEPFGENDQINTTLDYRNGIVYFEKNGVVMFSYKLKGKFLNSPIMMGTTCKTRNLLFFRTLP